MKVANYGIPETLLDGVWYDLFVLQMLYHC